MHSKTQIVIAAAATALMAGAIFAQGRPGGSPFGPGELPEEAAACIALGEPEQVRACLQELRGGQDGPHADRPNSHFDSIIRFFAVEYVGLTEQQQTTFRELMQAHRAQSHAAKRELAEGFRAIREAAKNGDSIDMLADEQGQRIAESIKQGATGFADAKARLNLTADQESKIERLMELFGHHGPGGSEFAGSRFGGPHGRGHSQPRRAR